MRRAVLALLLAGCSYDWTVARGAPPSDAGRDVLGADVSVSEASDAPPADVAEEPIVDASPMDSPSTGDGTGPDCAQLLQSAKNALGPALVCVPTMQNVCKAQAHDWCGCTVYLADGTSTAYTTFVDDVNAFESAGCRSTIFCPDTCPSASSGICVISDAAGMYACYE
ncbi:MAG TPA: hypothetical protein VF765_07730 [Polyangiaceae bacterium]